MRALWIDDQVEKFRPHIKMLKNAGVHISTCSTWEHARNLLESKNKFDVVISDIPFHPESGAAPSGIEFFKKIKSNSSSTKIIGLTAYSSLDHDVSTLFDNVVDKSLLPFPGNSLLPFFHDFISSEISDTEGLDRDFVRNILQNEDFHIVSDLEREGLIPGTQEFSRYAEISYEINDLILKQACKCPDVLWEIDDRRFEEICATVLCREGFRVHLTSKSRDGGYDLMAFHHDGYLTSLYLVECKRWHPKRKRVGVPIVRQLNGVVEQLSAHGGLIMSTTEFTTPAKQFASEPTVRIDLVDFLKLRSWMEKVTSYYK